MNPTKGMTNQNYLDVSCPTCGAVPKHGHVCTPPKDVEGIVDKKAQQISDLINDRCPEAPPALHDLIDIVMAELSTELTTHTDRRVREERERYAPALIESLHKTASGRLMATIEIPEVEQVVAIYYKVLSEQPKEL